MHSSFSRRKVLMESILVCFQNHRWSEFHKCKIKRTQTMIHYLSPIFINLSAHTSIVLYFFFILSFFFMRFKLQMSLNLSLWIFIKSRIMICKRYVQRIPNYACHAHILALLWCFINFSFSPSLSVSSTANSSECQHRESRGTVCAACQECLPGVTETHSWLEQEVTSDRCTTQGNLREQQLS